MKAVGLYKHLPIEDPQSLVDLDLYLGLSINGFFRTSSEQRTTR
jgi:hypothetical protein